MKYTHPDGRVCERGSDVGAEETWWFMPSDHDVSQVCGRTHLVADGPGWKLPTDRAASLRGEVAAKLLDELEKRIGEQAHGGRYLRAGWAVGWLRLRVGRGLLDDAGNSYETIAAQARSNPEFAAGLVAAASVCRAHGEYHPGDPQCPPGMLAVYLESLSRGELP